METKMEYLIKVKIPKLIFFIFISLAIPTYLLIATQMNPAVFIFFLQFFMGIYHLINSWHDVYIEDNKMVFHKSILFNTRILIPINDINKCVIHYREYPLFHWDKTDIDNPIWSQAFSTDNGKTWEWNWYMYTNRIK